MENYDEAIICCDKALEIDSKIMEVWVTKGIAYVNVGKYIEAIECFDKALEINPNFIYALSNKGHNLTALKKYDEAIECYDKALEIDPNFISAWSGKGDALFESGKLEKATKCYDKIIEINPNDEERIWNKKGGRFYSLKKYDEAVYCYTKALEVDSSYASTWRNKGLVLSVLDKYDEAIKCYDKAIELDQNYIEAWCEKGNIFFSLKDYEKAIQYYDKAIELDPNYFNAWYFKCNLLNEIGKYSEAVSCCNEMLKLDSENKIALNSLTRIYSEYLNDYDKAVELSFRLLEIDPNFSKMNLADNLIKAQRYADGRKYALKAFDENLSIKGQYVNRFLIISSYFFEGDTTNGGNELIKFLDDYKELNMDFEDKEWIFSGSINAISNINIDSLTRFLLLTLIDILQGKIDKKKFSFFNTFPALSISKLDSNSP